MIVNLTDANGNVIGTLELPDDTPADQVAYHQGLYSYVPPSPTVSQRVSASLAAAIAFGLQITESFAEQNILQGITASGKTGAVADYCQTMSYYLHSGSLYQAISQINVMIADTSDAKTSLSPFITNDILYVYLNKIQNYLSMPLTPNPGSGS